RVLSSRELAIELGLSRIPILNAYDQLLSEGFLESRRKIGTFVSESWLDWQPKVGNKKDSSQATSALRTISRRATAVASVPLLRGPGAFAIGQVAADLFPFHVWSRLVARHSKDAKSL